MEPVPTTGETPHYLAASILSVFDPADFVTVDPIPHLSWVIREAATKDELDVAIVSPTILTLLQAGTEFERTEPPRGGLDVREVGALGQIRVYLNPVATKDIVLLGSNIDPDGTFQGIEVVTAHWATIS